MRPVLIPISLRRNWCQPAPSAPLSFSQLPSLSNHACSCPECDPPLMKRCQGQQTLAQLRTAMNALVFESSSIGPFAAAGTTTMHMLCESRAAPAARASYQ